MSKSKLGRWVPLQELGIVPEVEDTSVNQTVAKPNVISSVASTIADGSIVWIKDNMQVHCGQVRKVYADDKQALVMNFDKWSDWLVDFDKIIRVGVSYYTDDYRHYSSQQHCL